MIGGDYVGRDYDSPNAPWNERPVECPLCRGAGYRYYAYSLRSGEEVEVTRHTLACLPKSEAEAENLNEHYCRADDPIRICPLCDGNETVDERIANEYRR